MNDCNLNKTLGECMAPLREAITNFRKAHIEKSSYDILEDRDIDMLNKQIALAKECIVQIEKYTSELNYFISDKSNLESEIANQKIHESYYSKLINFLEKLKAIIEGSNLEYKRLKN